MGHRHNFWRKGQTLEPLPPKSAEKLSYQTVSYKRSVDFFWLGLSSSLEIFLHLRCKRMIPTCIGTEYPRTKSPGKPTDLFGVPIENQCGVGVGVSF